MHGNRVFAKFLGSDGLRRFRQVHILSILKAYTTIIQGSFFPPHRWGGSGFQFPPQTPLRWGGNKNFPPTTLWDGGEIIHENRPKWTSKTTFSPPAASSPTGVGVCNTRAPQAKILTYCDTEMQFSKGNPSFPPTWGAKFPPVTPHMAEKKHPPTIWEKNAGGWWTWSAFIFLFLFAKKHTFRPVIKAN